jgi:multiple sugar transport system ATP-binding protein
LPPHKRNVAFVFQSYALYPHLTASENLAFPLELAHVPRETIRQRVQEVSSSLGIGALLDKRPAQLSGGERQRVALGRAIIRHPDLFLFDAPLRAQMRKELRELHRQLNTTFIYVTHDQEEALSLSDRIAVMQAGRIQQCDSPRAVYDQPANRFVASFFGSPPMNFLSAELRASPEGAFVQVAGRNLHIGGLSSLPEKAMAVTLGIRPEDLRISRESAREAWPARITNIELHGGQTYLELNMNGFQLTAVERADVDFRPGENVGATVATERLHLFDPQTGERLTRAAAQ